MEEKLIHIAGPIYVSKDSDSPYFDSDTKQLSPQWIETFFAGLDVLSERLPELIKPLKTSQFSIHAKFEGGWISDGFFDSVPLSESNFEAIRRFVDAAIASAPYTLYEEMAWATDESHLGQYAAGLLGVTNVKDVSRFIRYMEVCDLDHEVDHGSQFEQVVMAHGWTPETIAVWVARNGNCCGQHGHEATWETPKGDSIEDWIGVDESRRNLVVRLIGAHILNMLSWDERSLTFGVQLMLDTIDTDTMDIFFNPEILSTQGLGESAQALTLDAANLAKKEAKRHFNAGSTPSHWLDILGALV